MVMTVGVLLVLVVLDAVSTLMCLRRGCVEANPVLRWCIDKVGAPMAVICSHLLVGLALAGMGAAVSPFLLGVLTAMYGRAVYSNFRLLRRP